MDAQRLKEFFERCYFVNLDRRPDRLEWFQRRFAEYDWPFAEPQRFPAIDGQRVPWPQWWTQGGGAWGIYRSNLKIIETCLMDQCRSVLILEDDATLNATDDPEISSATFRDRAAAFLSHVPHDWEQIYLGGQHLFPKEHPPRQINAHVVVPYNINRLHAYALSNAGMKVAFQHLTSHHWQKDHHIDHHFGALQQAGGIKVYAPTKWMVGQFADKSDICDRELRVRFWNPQPPAANQNVPGVIVVLGPYRGGTSCVAGAMHYLGIVMGHHFFQGGRGASPKGCFEAQKLYNICLACYPEPAFEEGKPYRQRVQSLRLWLMGRRNERPVIGAKHPKLCLMIPEMLEAWPGCRFVVVNRPIDASVESLRNLGWWSKRWNPRDLITRLVDTRNRDLQRVPADRVLQVEYERMLKDPEDVLTEIASFSGIEPTREQYQRAIAHVSSDLQHYGKGEAA